MCCELVDSFSDAFEWASALTIFPSSSAAKATSVAMLGSPGRAIDRFGWCEGHRFSVLADTSPDAHTG